MSQRQGDALSGLYKRFQFAPVFALPARSQYFSDRGGLFSRALKEPTLAAGFKLAEGFLTRLEWRRDFSNRPFFLTDQLGQFKKEQNTATGGLLRGFGGKQGAW
jgi:hypothetical protein